MLVMVIYFSNSPQAHAPSNSCSFALLSDAAATIKNSPKKVSPAAGRKTDHSAIGLPVSYQERHASSKVSGGNGTFILLSALFADCAD